MKRNITTVLLTLATAFGFAQNSSMLPNIAQSPTLPYLSEKVAPRKSFGYLKMGVTDNDLEKTADIFVIPGFGLGYRMNGNSSAIDISASFNLRRSVVEDVKNDTYYYTLPKVNYLYYLSSKSNNSFYAGAGFALGGVESKDEMSNKNTFIGLIPNIALGYELNRTGVLRGFIQLDVSQPAIAAVKDGAFPKAYADVSIGAGF